MDSANTCRYLFTDIRPTLTSAVCLDTDISLLQVSLAAVALRLNVYQSVGQFPTLVQPEKISTTIGWTVMQLCTYICGPQKLNPSNTGNPPTFAAVSPAG